MTVTAWHLELGWLVRRQQWCASSILVPLLLDRRCPWAWSPEGQLFHLNRDAHSPSPRCGHGRLTWQHPHPHDVSHNLDQLGKASRYQPSGRTLASCSNHCFKSAQTSFTVLSVYSCKILGPVAMHSSRTIPKAHSIRPWPCSHTVCLDKRKPCKEDQLDTSTQQQHS